MQLPMPSQIGQFKRVAAADPSAGNEFTFTVPAGKAWYVVSVTVALVQGITQTPQPALVLDDGTVGVATIMGSTAAQAVSTTCQYTWAPGLVTTGQVGAGAGVVSNAPLPDYLVLLAGWRMRSLTAGIGGNSDYGVASALVCELG